MLPVGFWRGAGIPRGPRVNTFIECGCCGAYHRTDFYGDCRENSERYSDIPDNGVEVWEDDPNPAPITTAAKRRMEVGDDSV